MAAGPVQVEVAPVARVGNGGTAIAVGVVTVDVVVPVAREDDGLQLRAHRVDGAVGQDPRTVDLHDHAGIDRQRRPGRNGQLPRAQVDRPCLPSGIHIDRSTDFDDGRSRRADGGPQGIGVLKPCDVVVNDDGLRQEIRRRGITDVAIGVESFLILESTRHQR